MRLHTTMLIALTGIGLTVVAGCNSTDALTPQVDVGGGTFRSPPVNQTDLDSMTEQTAYVTPPKSVPLQSMAAQSMAIQSGSLPLSGVATSSAPPTVMEQGDMAYSDPAGTLDAQAGRLARGNAPAQLAAPRQGSTAEEDVPVVAGTTAAAEPEEAAVSNEPDSESAAAQQPASQEPADQQPSDQQTADQQPAENEPAPAQTAALPPQTPTQAGSIRFLPIIGAPVSAVTPLSKQLGMSARSDGLVIKAASDTASQHILKGYFSALKDGNKTTVIYVWDVLDNAGNRLHRIQGQESVAASSPDLWSAVPAQTMETIATRTIEAYQDWRRSQAG